MTDQQAPAQATGGESPPSERRSTVGEVAQALDLGWRLAALHTLDPVALEPLTPVGKDMLLNRRGLSAPDRLELEVKAIAGVAFRAGVALEPDELGRLLLLAGGAHRSHGAAKAFRAELARHHIDIEKRLWATNEPAGKAYELGNFLSDTWNRITRPAIHPDPHSELAEIFDRVRVERIKLLLDDLQARIDPVATHAVSNHLDEWCDRVANATLPEDRGPAAHLTLAENVKRLEPVERQTIIWRQMLTGDKEPEAWIGQAERAEVRDEFTQQVWSRYKRWWWVAVLVALAAGGLGYWYSSDPEGARGVAAGALALLAMFGLTRASMTGALKTGARNWSELMWNRALAAVICRKTSMVRELYGPAQPAPASGGPAQRTNSTSTVSPASSDSRSSGTNA
ncbi:MAG: hypothetical protein QOE31_3967 [Solirubrobacteraceae bacterium]|jgi:hypothetical protein|nr:hypothetical protein [Solirubrobacteraceae bacterium]